MKEDGVEKDVSEVLSPESAAHDPKLRLPVSTDPPGQHNPPKQLVWLVRVTPTLEVISVGC